MDTIRVAARPEQVGFQELLQAWLGGPWWPANIVELNQEVSAFMNLRLTRDQEAMRAIAQCRTIPEMVQVQFEWARTAFDDYARQTEKLIGITGRPASPGRK